jgi:hypothetical protein
MNVSEGGLALTSFGPAAVERTVTIQFGLPETSAQVLRAEGRFSDRPAFPPHRAACRLSFEAWLEPLEAQLQFRESIQSGTANVWHGWAFLRN